MYNYVIFIEFKHVVVLSVGSLVVYDVCAGTLCCNQLSHPISIIAYKFVFICLCDCIEVVVLA